MFGYIGILSVYQSVVVIFWPSNQIPGGLTRDMEAEAESSKFSWKQKLEAVKGYRFRLTIHIKCQKLECEAIFCEIFDKK